MTRRMDPSLPDYFIITRLCSPYDFLVMTRGERIYKGPSEQAKNAHITYACIKS